MIVQSGCVPSAIRQGRSLRSDLVHAVCDEMTLGHRSSKQKALCHAGSQLDQARLLLGGFDPFDDQRHIQRLCQGDRATDDRSVSRPMFHLKHKSAIELDLIEWQITEPPQ